jgi:hypothetical protein
MADPPSIFNEPRSEHPAPLSDNYIQPDLGHGLRIWWAFYWRTLLSTYIVIVVINVSLRELWLNGAIPAGLVRPISLIIRYDSYPIYYILAFVALALVLRKKFRDFRLGLLSKRGGEGAQILPPTFARTARIWWTFCWRAVVYRIIVAVAVMFPLGWITAFLVALVPGNGFAALVRIATQLLLDGVVGIFVIYSNILDEDISDFRVALVPRAADVGAITAPTAAGMEPS